MWIVSWIDEHGQHEYAFDDQVDARSLRLVLRRSTSFAECPKIIIYEQVKNGI